MWDKATKKMVETFDFIEKVKNQFQDMDSWRPLADCPWYRKVKNEKIVQCLKQKREKCACLGKYCKYERKK